MKNFLQLGDVLVVTNSSGADVKSGDFLVAGNLLGVCQVDIANGASGPIVREGIFSLPKATGTAWSQGDGLFWDAGAKKFTKTAAGNRAIGVAAAAALGADATGAVAIEEPVAGARFMAGQVSTVTAADTIATGLSTVIACGATLDSDPGDDPMLVSATIGDQAGAPVAGSIIIKTWKNTAGTDPTPLAAATFTKKVNWWAFGT